MLGGPNGTKRVSELERRRAESARPPVCRRTGRAAFRERTTLVIEKGAESRELGRLSLFAADDYSTTGITRALASLSSNRSRAMPD